MFLFFPLTVDLSLDYDNFFIALEVIEAGSNYS